MSKISLAAAVTTALLVAACGNSQAPQSAAATAERGIYISTQDCTDGGKLTPEQCEKVIDMAVALHEAEAPSFKTLRQCEAQFGLDRCDKTVDGHYRPHLQAFFVVMTDPPTAVPLYPPAGNDIAFRSHSNQIVHAYDETLRVSSAAMTLAHENAKLPSPDSATNANALGEAAADIH